MEDIRIILFAVSQVLTLQQGGMDEKLAIKLIADKYQLDPKDLEDFLKEE